MTEFAVVLSGWDVQPSQADLKRYKDSIDECLRDAQEKGYRVCHALAIGLVGILLLERVPDVVSGQLIAQHQPPWFGLWCEEDQRWARSPGGVFYFYPSRESALGAQLTWPELQVREIGPDGKPVAESEGATR